MRPLQQCCESERFWKPTVPEATRRPRILIIARGDIARFVKIIKLAATLSEVGYEVVRLGLRTSPDIEQAGSDEFGEVLWVDQQQWSRLPQSAAQSAEPAGSPGTGSAQNSLRESLKRVLFRLAVGRRLREWVIRRRTRQTPKRLLERVHRWNDRLVERGMELKPDLVISSQLDVLEAGHAISRRRGIPLVYDVRDLFTAAGYPNWSDSRFVKYERRMIRDASLVTTVAPRIASFLERQHGIARPVVLYNCNMTRAESTREPGYPVKLLFQGFFSRVLLLPDLVHAVKLLDGAAVLTLQGEGAAEEELRALVDDLELQRLVEFVSFVSPLQAPLAANLHDIGISHRRADNENLRLSLPNKLFDYLGGGLAVLSSDIPSVRDVIEAHDCGMLFNPSGPEAIVEAVLAMSSDRDRLWDMKRNALAAWEHYSWDKQGEKLVRAIDEILPADGLAR